MARQHKKLNLCSQRMSCVLLTVLVIKETSDLTEFAERPAI